MPAMDSRFRGNDGNEYGAVTGRNAIQIGHQAQKAGS